ncbi:pitrilysin family protein [Gaopeijia maritima]|uniref:M16 family metallopeptidase n=1 Tax=Gaopeijia maritima TaxID=3119007 RepID=UPI00324CDCA8
MAAALVPPTVEAQEPTPLSGLELPVREVVLDNGMRFLLLPRPGAPTVAFVVEYAVGGVNEVPGTTGIAHLLEHMLFKGSTTIGTTDVEAERAWFERMDAAHDSVRAELAALAPDSVRLARLRTRIAEFEDSARVHVIPNEFDRILSRNGARGLNATTSSEATTYFVELPANRTELWFALESDRMRSPVFREFHTERDVVVEERRMRVDTSPGGLLYETHLAAAFAIHPYGQPVVGTMADLEAASRDEVARYYRRYYGPRNATVAIVGDIDPDQLAGWAESYFGDIAPGERPPPITTREPEQRGRREVRVEFDANPAVRFGWKVPSVLDDDAPALAVLASLLTGGRASRLYRRIVERDRLATGVAASAGPGDLFPRLFMVEATPRDPHTPQEIEAAIVEELAALAAEPPSEAEVDRVRVQIEAGRVRRLRSNLGLAFQLASSASSLGEWRTTFELAERMTEVRPTDVQRVVQRYFQDRYLTVATLVRPEAGGDPDPDVDAEAEPETAASTGAAGERRPGGALR